MNYEDIKKKYSKTASERSGKIRLAQMKVERMQAAYEEAENERWEAVEKSNKHICKETADELREATARANACKERLTEAKRQLEQAEISDEDLNDIVDGIC